MGRLNWHAASLVTNQNEPTCQASLQSWGLRHPPSTLVIGTWNHYCRHRRLSRVEARDGVDPRGIPLKVEVRLGSVHYER